MTTEILRGADYVNALTEQIKKAATLREFADCIHKHPHGWKGWTEDAERLHTTSGESDEEAEAGDHMFRAMMKKAEELIRHPDFLSAKSLTEDGKVGRRGGLLLTLPAMVIMRLWECECRSREDDAIIADLAKIYFERCQVIKEQMQDEALSRQVDSHLSIYQSYLVAMLGVRQGEET